MATQLKNIVRFVAVPPAGAASLPHGLRISPPGGGDLPQVPDLIALSAPDFSASADDTDITVINNGPVPADVDVYCEHWHSLERAFGDAAVEDLIPQPFVLAPAGGAGGQDHSYLPEAWEMMDVAANQVAAVVSASVSQLFDEMVANRTMSILGIRTQLTEAITAGTLTVTVFVNGLATAALLVHNAGLNPSGGGAVFAPGLVTVLAGQTIGVRVTTNGAFLPVSTDLSVRVEVGT